MHRSQRWLGLGSWIVATLACACANGEDGGSGSFSATNLTYTTNSTPATTVPAGTTIGEPSTGGDPSTTNDPSNDPTGDPGAEVTGPPVTTGGPDPNTTAVDPSTTTNPDPSTTNVDPSTTTTQPDPSTTMPDPSTTNMTNMTNDDTTGDPPDPPPKDNQPSTGMYEHCTVPRMCDPPSNVCLQLQDQNMQVTDGFCTIFCTSLAQCGAAPNAPAVQECFSINAQQKICGLKCVSTLDCPTGMNCVNLALPNMQQGSYCI